MGDAEGRFLLDVGDADAEAAAIADGGHDLLFGIADDDADVADAALDEVLDGVEEDGLVGDGDELLGAGVGEGTQAAALAAAKDEPLELDREVQHAALAPECRGCS